MKRQAQVWMGIVLAICLLLITGLSSCGSKSAKEDGPLVNILTPRSSLALNASSLRVQALVEAFSPATEEGSASSASISEVQFSVDGEVAETLNPPDCGKEVLADVRVNLDSMADGLHQLTVTAFQDGHEKALQASASVDFTLDRTLPEAPMNRVEEIATPAPLMCLSAAGDEAQHLIQGDIVPGALSDGLDPANEHFVIVLGTEVVSLPAGSFMCEDGQCEYSGASESMIRKATLIRQEDDGWTYSLEVAEMPPADSNMYLRFGNDWGAINLDTGKLVTGSEAEPDDSRSGHMMIGPAGGTVETTDAAGAVVRLVVPPDALTTDTDITVTPLLTSAIPGYSGVLHQGVRLEPEGLSFAQPATLTLDFAASGQTVESQHFIFLLTSPLTALPLISQPDGNTLSAPVSHFSTYEAGSGSSTFTELAEWGDPILESRDQPTLSEIQALLALAALQQAEGCTEGCLDLAYLTDWAMTIIEVLMGEACQQAMLDPSEKWLQKLLDLWAEYERIGTGDLSALTCIDEVLQALIEKDGAAAVASPTDANLQDLADRKTLAAQLGLDDLEALADAKMKAALFEIVQIAIELCPTDEEAAQEELDRAEDWGELIGSPSDLANAIGNARDNCGQEIRVVIDARHETAEGYYDASYAIANASTAAGRIEDYDSLMADGAAPVTFSVSAERAYVSATAASPGDGIAFTLDASAYASLVQPGYISEASAVLKAWMYIPGPGTLELELNPEWGTALGTAEATWRAFIMGPMTESGEGAGQGLDCSTMSPCEGKPMARISVPSAGTYYVRAFVGCTATRQSEGDWGYASGSGRVATIRWVPGAQ